MAANRAAFTKVGRCRGMLLFPEREGGETSAQRCLTPKQRAVSVGPLHQCESLAHEREWQIRSTHEKNSLKRRARLVKPSLESHPWRWSGQGASGTASLWASADPVWRPVRGIWHAPPAGRVIGHAKAGSRPSRSMPVLQ